MWNGQPLPGKTILIHCEQGFGDTIHFARYLRETTARGGRIILHCQARLSPLMRSIPGLDSVIAPPQLLPDFDFQCPLLSLPHVLNLPNPFWSGPYLHDQETSELPGEGKLKVGLIWSGRTHLPGRSIPLPMLSELADPRIQFFSLQIEEGSSELKSPPPGMNIIDSAPTIKDFADTAALMNQLDLVISIDTAAAQLAGVLGKAVWVLLKFVPDWRWTLDRTDTPWYPTARLFRQRRRDDWSAPIRDAAAELKKLLDSKAS